MLDQSQSLLSGDGPLAALDHFEGLYRISLLSPTQPGQWKLQAKSDGHLTFNVIGKGNVGHIRYELTALELIKDTNICLLICTR